MLLTPVRYAVWLFGRLALALRYRVTVVGRAAVDARPGPYLFLPNHPAFSDPPNVIAVLWPRYRVRPVVLETNFQNPALAPFAYLLNAIRVPDVSNASAEARRRAESALGAAVDALKAGDNVILWPGGRLSRDGGEHVGGARAAADILAAVPDVTVVLVRTRGLWGSRFSWATGVGPRLIRGFAGGAGLVAANFGLLTPRRRVTVTLEPFARDRRPEPTRDKINPWLDAWYNADTPAEMPTYVPYHFAFGPRTRDFPKVVAADGIDATTTKAATKTAVAEMLADRLKRPVTAAESDPARKLPELGLDSLDEMELALDIERRFGFAGGRLPTTVGELWALAEGRLTAGEAKPAPAGWSAPRASSDDAMRILGDTVGAAFLNPRRRLPPPMSPWPTTWLGY